MEICKNDSLRVDLYVNNKLFRRSTLIPLIYSAKNNSVDLVALAGALYPAPAYPAAYFFTADTRPSSPINWHYEKLRYTYPVTCEQINQWKGKYVAINLFPTASNWAPSLQHQFLCSICSLDAQFVNWAIMETFCSDVCHDVFLSNQ